MSSLKLSLYKFAFPTSFFFSVLLPPAERNILTRARERDCRKQRISLAKGEDALIKTKRHRVRSSLSAVAT